MVDEIGEWRINVGAMKIRPRSEILLFFKLFGQETLFTVKKHAMVAGSRIVEIATDEAIIAPGKSALLST